jgi:hypothetical protein
MKLTIYKNWFLCYNGKVYANKITDIHSRINNKANIKSDETAI